MGCFDYICIKKGKKCLTPIGGQHLVDDGTCYVTNKDCKLLLECLYSGYGYAEWNNEKIYDLSMEDFFENWDVELEDKKAYFVCQNCAKKIKKCQNFNELYEEPSEEELIKQRIKKLESTLDYLISTRDTLTKNIRSVRGDLKKIKVEYQNLSNDI